MKFLLLTVIALGGCVTPKQWSAEDHKEVMMTCKQACNGKMKSYNILYPQCMCRLKKQKLEKL